MCCRHGIVGLAQVPAITADFLEWQALYPNRLAAQQLSSIGIFGSFVTRLLFPRDGNRPRHPGQASRGAPLVPDAPDQVELTLDGACATTEYRGDFFVGITFPFQHCNRAQPVLRLQRRRPPRSRRGELNREQHGEYLAGPRRRHLPGRALLRRRLLSPGGSGGRSLTTCRESVWRVSCSLVIPPTARRSRSGPARYWSIKAS